MRQYDITLTVVCSDTEKIPLEEEERVGYRLTISGTVLELRGVEKTEDDLRKFEQVAGRFKEHCIVAEATQEKEG